MKLGLRAVALSWPCRWCEVLEVIRGIGVRIGMSSEGVDADTSVFAGYCILAALRAGLGARREGHWQWGRIEVFISRQLCLRSSSRWDGWRSDLLPLAQAFFISRGS